MLADSRLDLIDSAILDWLIVICNSKNERVIHQRLDGYTWINYQALITDMPLLRIKSIGAITPRIKRIEDDGFIETLRPGHRKVYARTTAKVDELFTKMNGAIHETEQFSEGGTIHENEPIIILNNHNTKIKETYGEFEKVKLTKDEYDKLVERLGEKHTQSLIFEMDAYIASKGDKYKSHYAALLTWASRKFKEYAKKKSNIAF